MASVNNIGLNYEENKIDNERTASFGMSGETSPSTVNNINSKKSYWFAHSGFDDSSKNAQPKLPVDSKDIQIQKDKEERIRVFHEKQEEERLKRLKDLEQQFLQAKKHREQQEEERKRRIDEARIREIDRRLQVEERKRQIWEAEQERKEAILRRNMEREARIEARRNAQRNSQCFAFGSSTPRTFDLDLAAIGVGRNASQGSVLMSSISGRRSEERELVPQRATSACSLDRKFGDDCMSRSMVSLSSSAFRGRKRTDITPTLTRERSITPHTTPRGNQPMRAVSMTRLDQLAQPRRTYRSSPTSATTLNGSPGNVSMSKSMCNLANVNVNRRVHIPALRTSKDSMSRSMMHLGDISSQKEVRYLPSPPSQSSMRPAQSMLHLASAPRLTRAARLRAQALAHNRALSAWNLNKPENYVSGYYMPGKDSSRSPSRPQSSMSGASEVSVSSSSISAVNMRPRPAPRKPRPYSIAGSSIDNSFSSSVTATKKSIERQPRVIEQNVVSTSSSTPHQRARSVGRDKNEIENVKPLVASKKPVPPPKSSQVLARAKSHPVPQRDNLRKPVKPGFEPNSSVNVKLKHQNEKTISKEKETPAKPEIELKLSNSSTEAVKSSPITSPATDSEMCISSDESKISAATESEVISLTQPVSEHKADDGVRSDTEVISASTNLNKNELECQNNENAHVEVTQSMKTTTKNVNEMLPNEDADSESALLKDFSTLKPKITSEEEAKAALAEKRRLAREQAEKEAELERLKQEEIRRQEEEQKRLEDLEQKRMEEEQIRLAELHRQLEEEKLRKAIEEQQQREKEKKEKMEEEARLKQEKEEQDKKVREEAEKQRIELEERLRKEEEERAERKKRVEQIMARTRNKGAAQSPGSSQVENSIKTSSDGINNSKTNTTSLSDDEKNSVMRISLSNGSSETKVESNLHFMNDNDRNFPENPAALGEKKGFSSNLPDLLNSEIIANYSFQRNGLCSENEKVFTSTSVSNRTVIANDEAALNQANGYSSHEDMSCTTSPEEVSDGGLLIDIESSPQKNLKIAPESAEFTKLTGFGPPLNNIQNDNYLIQVDDVNSNLLSPDSSYLAFDDTLQKKQDSAITDLLS